MDSRTKKVDSFLAEIVKNQKIVQEHIRGDCPLCKKSGKFYLNKTKLLKKGTNGKFLGSWNCFSCGEYGNINSLLYKFNRIDLLNIKEVTPDTLSKYSLSDDSGIDTEIGLLNESIPLPNLKPISSDYLAKIRGWSDAQIQKYEVLEDYNYLYFKIKQFGDTVALLGRRKPNKSESIAKFNNSKVDFSRIIGGIDDIKETTESIILVEGIFDKEAIDSKLNITKNEKWACVFSFGKSLKKPQIEGLINYKNIKRVYVAYDPDAMDSSIKTAKRLSKYYKEVFIIDLVDGDPDELPKEELKLRFKHNQINIFNFLEKKEL
jgi:5S rRNA maturation endonuclease (ribonuclease M5)